MLSADCAMALTGTSYVIVSVEPVVFIMHDVCALTHCSNNSYQIPSCLTN